MDMLRKYDLWIEFVRGLLGQSGSEFPRAAVAEFLDATIETAVVSWDWAEPDGSFGTELNRWPPGTGWPSTPDAEWARRVVSQHPLNIWYTRSGDPRPMTVDQIPPSAIPRWAVPAFREEHAAAGIGHQLTVPYRLERGSYRVFTLGRGEEDYPADDLELTRRIQPLLTLLDRQVSVLSEHEGWVPHPDLTGRETAVLHLLAGGSTARAIARRLGISPRTVHTHLQHIYRKLGVSDRLRAVLTARALGIVAPPTLEWGADPRVAPAGAQGSPEVVVLDRKRAGKSLSDLAYSYSAVDEPPVHLSQHG